MSKIDIENSVDIEIIDDSNESYNDTKTICYACDEQTSEFGMLVCFACLELETDLLNEDINDKDSK